MEEEQKKDVSEKEKEYLVGYAQKYIIYLDDDNSKKKKVAWIKYENNGYWIKIAPLSAPFWINTQRILKIKEVKKEEVDNGR